jgi:hypothetical protein
MDLCMVRDKKRVALVPATSVDEDRLRSIRHYEPMQVQTLFARTSKLNRWYRGLVGRVAEAIDVAPDALHADLKFKAGLIEQVMLVHAARGGFAVRLRSTAFPLMDETEFSRYVDVAVELMFRDYMPGIRSRERQRLIAEWVGRRPRLDPKPKVSALT